MSLFLAVISGLFLAVLFPKFNLFYLAWVALIPFFLAVYSAPHYKKALLYGFITGIVFFGINLFWITALQEFVGFWAYLAWFGVALLQTVYFLLFAVWVWWARNASLEHKLLALPAGYVAVEWLRSLGAYGVTAGGLGYSQSLFLPLLQLASIFSVYGISFVLVMANVFLAEAIYKRKASWKTGVGLGLLLLLVLMFGLYTLGSKVCHSSPAKKIFLVQANIPQKEKMEPSLVLKHLFKHLELSKSIAKEKPDFVVWPETAVPFYLLNDFNLSGFRQDFFAVVKEGNFNLILGVPTYLNMNVYNSMVLVDKSTNLSQYNKEKLVPFGEYLPFRPLLFPLLSKTGFLEGDYIPGRDFDLLQAEGVKIGGAICFESTFPGLIRKRVVKGAEVILVITNDAWFFNSEAPYQHLQAGVLRAVENRRYFIQSANTGISAIIDPWGRVVKQTQLNEQTILKGEFYPCRAKSAYTVTGDLFVFFCLAIVAAYGAILRKRSARI
ncbi:MAG: apolipoprotein N-acyltransferase [Candidatus Saganbacteria bacterium]|nr:apolipoprotein N-acyltransferase [Candidatus Saganbacteria bacterium]